MRETLNTGSNKDEDMISFEDKLEKIERIERNERRLFRKAFLCIWLAVSAAIVTTDIIKTLYAYFFIHGVAVKLENEVTKLEDLRVPRIDIPPTRTDRPATTISPQDIIDTATGENILKAVDETFGERAKQGKKHNEIATKKYNTCKFWRNQYNKYRGTTEKHHRDNACRDWERWVKSGK